MPLDQSPQSRYIPNKNKLMIMTHRIIQYSVTSNGTGAHRIWNSSTSHCTPYTYIHSRSAEKKKRSRIPRKESLYVKFHLTHRFSSSRNNRSLMLLPTIQSPRGIYYTHKYIHAEKKSHAAPKAGVKAARGAVRCRPGI